MEKNCTTWDVENPLNNGINYQPQLVSRISCINSGTQEGGFLKPFSKGWKYQKGQ